MKLVTPHAPLAAFAAGLMMTGAVLAQPPAVAATVDLNIRSGPGPQYETIGVIKAGDGAELAGCVAESKWCQVSYSGTSGWAYSDYLTADADGSVVVLTERRAELPVTEYKDDNEGAAAGAVGGAVVGALVGGPIGAVVGGAAGAAVGDAVDPPETVRTYVRDNAPGTVYLEGEVVVGAEVPAVVAFAEISEYDDYRYARINGQLVLIEPDSRRIVYIFRD